MPIDMGKYQAYLINGICLILGLAGGWVIANYNNVNLLKIGVDFGGGKGVNLEMNSPADPSINYIDVLEKMFSEPFSIAGTKSWLKENKGLYDMYDQDLCDTIKALPYEDKFCKNLRDILEANLGPFAFKHDTISIGFPGGKMHEGIAYVPNNSKYRGKKVEIVSRQYKTQILVDCIAAYSCTGALKNCPDMQISHEDAKMLFPEVVLPSTLEAVATIIQ